jgi:DnaK suppressor protein
MQPEERDKLEQHIRNRLQTIRDDIDAFRASSAPVAPDSAIGRLTRMEAINSQNINEAALRKALATRSLLEKALRSIGTDDFGLCQACEEPIAVARLMVMPEATLCVACASRHE